MFELLNKKATESMTDEEIDELFDSDEKENIADLEDLIKKIHSGTSREEIFASIRNECEKANVADYLIHLIEEEDRPFEDTRFLREMESSRFKGIIDYIFEFSVLRSESKEKLIENSKLNEEEVFSVIKLINTVMQYCVIRKYTYNNFVTTLKSIFGFNKDQLRFLWDLFYVNREELQMMFVMRGISDLMVRMNELQGELNSINKKLDSMQ